MRIFIVTGRLWHSPQLVDAFKELGHEVFLLSSERYGISKPIFPSTALKVMDRLGPLKFLGKFLFSWRAKTFISSPDLLIIWSSYGLCLKDITQKTPTIIVRGNSHIDDQIRILGLKGLSIRLDRLLELTDYKKANLITVPTREIAVSESWGLLPVRVNPYAFPRIVEKRVHTLNRNRLKVIFVGAFTYRKGADRLLRLFDKDVFNIEFGLLGHLDKKFLKIPTWWKTYGFVAPNFVGDVLASQDVLILLSREEGMARVGLEAIARGIPIIVTKETGLLQWVNLGCGIVVPSEPTKNDIENAFNRLRENYGLISNRCYEISNLWSWSDHAKELFNNITGLNLSKS